MELRRFGRTELRVSPLAFGGAEIGLLELGVDEVERLLGTVLDSGINVIDTAAMYRESEALIGRAVADRRDEYVLISKCGPKDREFGEPAWSPELIHRSIDRSLRDLRTDHLDGMLLHSCEAEVLDQGDAWAAMLEARDAGKVRHVGYSGDNDAAYFATQLPELSLIQTSVNLFDQANLDRVLPACAAADVGVMAKRSIGNAAWKPPASQPGGYASYAAEYRRRFERMDLDPVALGMPDNGGGSWVELALRFTLAQPPVHTAVVGTTNPDHVRSNVTCVERGGLEDETCGRIRSSFASAAAADERPWPGER